MKKRIQWFLFCLLALTGFNACGIDEELGECPPVVKEPITVTARLYCNGREIVWPDTARIGVVMLAAGTNQFAYTPPVKTYFLSDTTGPLFLPLTDNQAIGRPDAGSAYDAVGLHPSSLAVSNDLTLPFSIADQSDRQALDLIMAKRTTGITHQTDTVRLDFYRQMSRLRFNLSLTEVNAAGDSINASDKLTGATIEVNGMDVSAVFSWKDFLLSTSRPATFQAGMQPDGRSGESIVYPRKAAEGVTFKLTLPQYPDTTYVFGMDPELELAAGMSYTFALNLVYRPSKPEPVPQHSVNYQFEGDANSSNITVYKNDLSTVWPAGETVRIDEHGSFSFGYDSNLDVKIRTADGKDISLSPGVLYSFTDIADDVTIIISAVKKVVTHQIKYEFEGVANSSNVTVYKNDLSTPWPADEVITLEEGSSFNFGYNSRLVIKIRTADGKSIPLTPDNLHRFTDITGDMTIIISASREDQMHRVKYQFEGEANNSNVKVYKNDLATLWPAGETVSVDDLSSFTFGYESRLVIKVRTAGGQDIPLASGGLHELKNITSDITIIISASKEDQRHQVKYQFEGDASADNVKVYKNDLATLWPVGEILYIDDLTNFSFGYDSPLVVKVSTTDGQAIVLEPNKLHEFTNIMDDITITIAVRKEDQSYKVNYQFEGAANASNVKVFKNNLTTSWGTTDDVTIPYGNDFSFGYTSDLAKVAVRVADGQNCPVTSGNLYTLHKITSDIILIISAPTQRLITYEYKGTLSRTNAPVQGTTAEVAYPDWVPDQTLYVANGDDFTFRYDKQSGYTGDVTVTLNGEVKVDIISGTNFTLSNVTENMHFILYDKKYHTVKVVTNLPDQEVSEKSWLVVSGESFELTPPSGSNLVVKVDGQPKTPVNGKYLLENVTKDTQILITADKGTKEPDLIIKADVHVWDELPVVDGGVIVPDNN